KGVTSAVNEPLKLVFAVMTQSSDLLRAHLARQGSPPPAAQGGGPRGRGRQKAHGRAPAAIRPRQTPFQALTIVNGNRAPKIAPSDRYAGSTSHRPTAAQCRPGPTSRAEPRSPPFCRGLRRWSAASDSPISWDGTLIARMRSPMRASKLLPGSLVAAAALALALQPVAAVPLPKPRPASAPASAGAKPSPKAASKADAKSTAPRP